MRSGLRFTTKKANSLKMKGRKRYSLQIVTKGELRWPYCYKRLKKSYILIKGSIYSTV